ncbi:hypothetical protein PINS_up006873 [Pythium insidiosum]|nr:hypothetical protein PINS_up006873 [Pythium insidiosum]
MRRRYASVLLTSALLASFLLSLSQHAVEAEVLAAPFAPIACSHRLTQFSSDGFHLCAVTDTHLLVCRVIRHDDEWRSVTLPDPKRIDSVTVSNGVIWGITTEGAIMSTQIANSAWWGVAGNVRRLSSNKTNLCGIDSEDFAVCAERGLNHVPNWKRLSNKVRIRDIDIHSGIAVAVAADGSTWYPSELKTPSSNGPFVSISSDAMFACAVRNDTGGVWCSAHLLSAWNEIGGGPFTQVTVNDRRLVALARNGSLYSMYLTMAVGDVASPQICTFVEPGIYR